MKRIFLSALVLLLLGSTARAGDPPHSAAPVEMAGLKAPAQVTRDEDGIFHVRAGNADDLYFLNGWVHARDRLFQMDNNRRLASGTLAELLGSAALASDVQLRTIGLRRAAERSLPALSTDTQQALAAYARGVNAWVAANPLPREYAALELTKFDPWTALDTVVVGKLIAFGLSFDLDIDRTRALQSYIDAGLAAGLDGDAASVFGATLFHEDLDRSAPFDPAATVPDASVPSDQPKPRPHPHKKSDEARAAAMVEAMKKAGLRHEAMRLGRDYLDKVRRIPLFERILDRDKRDGSNLWAVSGEFTDTGRPLVANDPHLQLGTPSTFYPMELEIPGRLEVFGSGFPGVAGIVQGYNRHISWGTTNNAIDVTDTFQEQVVPDPTSPSGLSTVYQGNPEHIIPIPETFRANQPGNGVADDLAVIPPISKGGPVPDATLIVPRRNFGPIISLEPATGVALSVQYTGFSPTRELDTFLQINHAKNLDEFKAALQFLDFGSQNFVYGDDRGNIAYFTTGEMPVREDLQAMKVSGLPPWFIRNGQGGNEWLPVQHPQPNQAVPYEVLPFSEMPQIVNPPAGWFVNANNDPAGLTLDNDPLDQLRPGGGIYYLAYAWDRGFRAGRITQRLDEYLSRRGGRMSFEKMQAIQADVVLRDAEYFTPWIVQAFRRARTKGAEPALAAFASDPAMREAVRRFAVWNRSTPTGLQEGWDAGKPAGERPRLDSIRDSVAASIYAAWRSRFIANTVDAALVELAKPIDPPITLSAPGNQEVLSALRNLLDNFAARKGKGASGVDFFVVPGIHDANDRRDIVILKSLKDALDLLASDAFKPAFGNSTNQDDYRWGKLHRIVFRHPLGGPFSIPPAGGAFLPPLDGLDGIPTDGGFQTVDASSHSVRADTPDEFMFGAGPVRRFVSEPAPRGPRSESIWPGGTSGVLGSPFYFQFLEKWLANEAIPLLLGSREVRPFAEEVEKFVPPAPHGRG